MVGPSFLGKTYLKMKVHSRLTADGDIFIITKSTPEQYSTSEIKFNEIGEKSKPLNEYENASIVFDDVLGSSNSRDIDQFFIRGRHNHSDIYVLPQS